MTELRETVRERYAAAAISVKRGMAADDVVEEACCDPADGYGLKLYDITERGTLPDEAILASLRADIDLAAARSVQPPQGADLGFSFGQRVERFIAHRQTGSLNRLLADERIA